MRHPLLACLLLLVPSAGCIAFNADCTGLVDDPDEVIGYLAQDVPISEPFARHANNGIGQLAADALLHAEGGSTPAVLGIFNGGAIREEGVCFRREKLARGALTRGELHDILPFENLVTLLDVTEVELVALFENAVSRLHREGEALTLPSGSGRFLHVSEGTQLTVDCGQAPGSRVAGLSIGGQEVAVAAPREEVFYRLAMPDFLLQGNDGYSMLAGLGADPARNPSQAVNAGGFDVRMAAAYMRSHYLEVDPSQEGGLRVHPRIVFQSCAQP